MRKIKVLRIETQKNIAFIIFKDDKCNKAKLFENYILLNSAKKDGFCKNYLQDSTLNFDFAKAPCGIPFFKS